MSRLTPDELFDWTGYRQKGKQAEWLKKNRIKFTLNAQLQPKVDRQHYLGKMGAAPSSVVEVSGPDWSAMSNVIQPRAA